MLLKKFKKLFFASVTTFLLLSFYGGSTCLASGWSSEIQWGPQSGSYSPDWGNSCMYYYDGLQGGYKSVEPMARFHFTTDAVNAIRNYYNNNSYYYTFDISIPDDYNWSLNAYEGGFYSTLPSPYFDVDDDGGNGYNDESEVTSESPTQIVAGTDYRFESYFQILNDTVYNQFNFTSQMSRFDWYMWEYNTVYYQDPPHVVRTFPWW